MSWSLMVLACVAVIEGQLAESIDVIYAVNCGGNEHVDINGVRYQRDSLTIGIPSDYGRNLNIQRVAPSDAILYQTERYDTQSFSYEMPLRDDGQYVLVLKFSEVWFTAPNQKVFSVVLNEEHTIVDNLDIYYRVGLGVAHDEIITFSVRNGRMCLNQIDCSELYENKVLVKFVKGERDNPKINAIVLYKGSVDEVPKLAPHPAAERLQRDFEKQREAETITIEDAPEEFTNEDEESFSDWQGDASQESAQGQSGKSKKQPVSGPPVSDPYTTSDPGSLLIPIVVAIGAFVPIIFCLCKV